VVCRAMTSDATDLATEVIARQTTA